MKTLPLAIISASIIGAAITVSAQEQPEFKWGGDIRLRTVYIDDVPMANGTSYDESSFQRYRTRLWTEFHPSENLFLNARFINEFRTQQTGDRANGWERYDETVIDNLFIDYQNDLFDLRIGRQDMTYGTGKLILDGTPMDGSRSIYFDAIKVTYKGFENTTVDLFAMYTKAENELALNSENRNLVWNTNPAYDGAEAGGGVYIKNSSIDDLPWESYWILKTQEDGLSDDTHTAGARLMPKIAENITGNLEFAYQSDTEDLDGFMIDALATFSLAEKTKLGLGWYYLSSDWNPIFSRWPQYSEAYVYGFSPADGGVGRWSNMNLPHIDVSVSLTEKLKMDFLLGYMFAPENNGVGGGHNRGLLFTWKNTFTLAEGLISEKDKLTGHLLVEMIDPGDYYNGTQQDELAGFLRSEISYSF